MLKVIRIECPTQPNSSHPHINRGAYAADIADYISDSDPFDGDDEVSPSPWSDPKLKSIWSGLVKTGKSEDYFFGFEDMESLTRWFHREDLLREHSHRYNIVEYKVLERHLGTSQCIFIATSVVERTVLENPWDA